MAFSAATLFSAPRDLEDRLLGPGLDRRRQAVEDVHGLVHPVPLMAGLGKDVAHGRPEPEGAIARHEFRRLHAPALHVSEQLRPGLRRLPVAVRDGDELLE